ncbi:ATP-binding cassette domain-containing protein [Bacillus ndiopicus]|uniref:ATP-binding cassette domain-containing protein n=1 Tax=Bacillus ndiopicus TaxID=1347368 RepID=UPI000B046F2B|nr:ATP-binding cassette domain-containing protein [Bacillus ndiopicus]
MILNNQLIVENIQYNYAKKNILQDVSFTCSNGIIALLGNNGAGKSTIMKIIAGMMKPAKGKVLLNNQSILTSQNYPIHKIGYLPQDFDIYGNVSGYDFLSYVYDIKKLKQPSKKQVLDELIAKFNLEEVIYKKFSSYSGGYKRRLGIAQAVLGEPKLIIIDEPSVGLDPIQRIEFRSYLAEISRTAITLISTHIIEDVELYSDEILILREQHIQFQGSVEQLIQLSTPHIYSANVQVDELIAFKKKVRTIEEKRISDTLIKVKFINNQGETFGNKEKEISLENAYVYFQNK